MSSMRNDPILTLADVMPNLFEDAGSTQAPMGKQLIVAKQIGPETLTDATTYSVPLLVAPANGTYLKRVYLVAMTAVAGGTNTVNVYRYDGSSDVQQLGSADYDPTGMSDKTAAKLTLTTTRADREATAGEFWWLKWVAGTQTTDAAGVLAVAVFVVPEVDAD